ncbi:MAG TPA: anti-sigma factor [Gaiellaceae bacterium]|nr:anti-sigma factor [Gaiellaceae bacterium]
MNREPNLDELIGAETTGAERQRLQHVHELLLEAGPPPEISAELEAGPTLGVTPTRRRRKPRPMLLLAAALLAVLVFFAGYSVRSTKSTSSKPVMAAGLTGTAFAPHAQGTIQVWNDTDGNGNWPMTLTVAGLPKLPPHNFYEVYLLRNGKPWGSCGTFRVGGTGSLNHEVTVTLSAPYSLHKGDRWVVTQPGAGGVEPGRTVLRPTTTA